MRNPYLASPEFKLKVIEVFDRSFQKGRNSLYRETTEKYYVEEQQKITIYKPGNTKVSTTFAFQVLNSQGRDLFFYIMYSLSKDSDIIRLDPKTVTAAMNISLPTFYRGVTNLKENMVITPCKRTEYWINPLLLFRGDRIDYYQQQCPDCIEVVAKQSTGQLLTDSLKKD